MSAEGLAELVAAMDGAMVVVTACGASGERDGCLVGFHSQCSIDPPRYAVWLSVANRTYELATGATHLAVHLLGRGETGLARHFGALTGDATDKLATVAWTAGPDGVPLLDDLPARFVGRIESRAAAAGGDHHLFVLDVVVADAPPPPADVLRLSDATHIDPGHAATDRR